MSVNNVNGNNPANAIYSLMQQNNAATVSSVQNNENYVAEEDVVELSGKEPSEQVQALKDDLNKNVEVLRQMVQALLEKQGGYAQGAGADFLMKVDQETQDWAKAQIAEDGYWGVDKTSERILNFAKSISGGDTSKVEQLRNAIVKGFEEAEKVWGGKLPDISRQTMDKVMAGLDEWAGISSSDS